MTICVILIKQSARIEGMSSMYINYSRPNAGRIKNITGNTGYSASKYNFFLDISELNISSV